MTRATIAGGMLVAMLLLALAVRRPAPEGGVGRAAAAPTGMAWSGAEAHEGFLYGRVTMEDGAVHEGRLRFGRDEEALWSNHFNGFKGKNPWVADAPPEAMKRAGRSVEVFGIEFGVGPRPDLGRPFMARFGDIARIEARGRDLQVTLKSGTVFHLDRYAADDFADGVRVWDGNRGVVDLGERRIRSIEFLPTVRFDSPPAPLYGTVHTRQGDFTGFVQWDREACLDSDQLAGRGAEGEVGLRFATIRSIERRSREGAAVTLHDGRELLLDVTREAGDAHRGMYVDDPRYGRVLISWEAFERVEFSSGGNAPAYDDFPVGGPLTGEVVTRSGRRLAGRLVFDLDESETTETLDAPSQGVDYTLPFGLIASIVPRGPEGRGTPGATVTLHRGEELHLDLAGDLDEGNGGILVFVEAGQRPEYVSWANVERIDFDRALQSPVPATPPRIAP